MARSRYIVPFLAIIAFVTGPQLVQSLTIEYCASTNTAATATNSSIYQSNGLCHDFCVDQSYAFAILQEHDCWCSDYVPAVSSQVDTDECDDSCPGWMPDTCGAKGLYGYIALDTDPSGTADGGSSSATSTSAAQSSTTSVDTTSSVTSITSSTSTTSTSTTSTTSSTLPDTTTKDTNTATTATTATTPTTSVKTVTAGGTVSLQTVTVTPTPAAGSTSGSDTEGSTSSGSSSHGLSSGAAAGVAIGVLAVVAIIAGIAVFFYLQRKKRRQEELNSRPHSNLSGSQGVMSTPTTTMASVWDGENTSTGRRSSRLMPHDPRMDPFATNIYTRFENKSRESINTLQDNQDYSRKVLRATNPDPQDE